MNYEIVVMTHNKHKIEEYRNLLSKHGITLYSLNDLNINMPEINESGKTFIENAIIKANALKDIIHMPIIADDSGLIIDALNGFPGIKTARFAEECGGQINANKELVKRLKGKNHNASFYCAIALVNVAENPLIFTGEVKGKISEDYKDEISFGYDPIFIPNGYEKTFYQLNKEIKNTISHRASACLKLITALKINELI